MSIKRHKLLVVEQQANCSLTSLTILSWLFISATHIAAVVSADRILIFTNKCLFVCFLQLDYIIKSKRFVDNPPAGFYLERGRVYLIYELTWWGKSGLTSFLLRTSQKDIFYLATVNTKCFHSHLTRYICLHPHYDQITANNQIMYIFRAFISVCIYSLRTTLLREGNLLRYHEITRM